VLYLPDAFGVPLVNNKLYVPIMKPARRKGFNIEFPNWPLC
jgi:hypothetical protein